MSRFITLSKNDPDFHSFLSGQFSSSEFAIPIRNLNVNSASESVTFKIIAMNESSLVKAFFHWYSLAKNIYLIFPILGGLSFLTFYHGDADPILVLLSAIALHFFLLSMTLRNDYYDYVNGFDRINEYELKKPLLMGLIRPYQAKRWSLFLFGLSVIFGSYCFFRQPWALAFALVGLLLSFGIGSNYTSRSYKGLSLVATFLMGGPLLVLGYEYLLYQTLSLPSLLLGGMFGYHALKYDFARQVRNIYFSSKANLITLSALFGFERSKPLYSLMSLLHLALLGGLILVTGKQELGLIFVVALFFEAYINKTLYSAESFLSSNIANCMSLQKLHYSLECSLLVFVFLGPQWLSLF